MAVKRSRERMLAEWVNVHYFEAPARRVISRRAGEPAELAVMLGGAYHAEELSRARRRRVDARAGDVVFWPEGAARREESDPADPARCVSVYFRWKNPTANLPLVTHDHGHLIRMLADRLLALKDAIPRFPDALRDAYLCAMLAEYIRLSNVLVHDLAARVARYTEEHMAAPFGIAELARHFKLQRHHFGRKYRAATGRTPMSDVRRIRAEHARALLHAGPEWTLKKIAPRVGVNDEHQLSRLLKRYIGIPVRELRR